MWTGLILILLILFGMWATDRQSEGRPQDRTRQRPRSPEDDILNYPLDKPASQEQTALYIRARGGDDFFDDGQDPSGGSGGG